VLALSRDLWLAMVAHALGGFPDEACGLLAGPSGSGAVTEFVPCVNADQSSRTFSLGPDAWAAIDELDGRGLEVAAVVHSHTHTEAYPSPTDVTQAANPFIGGWRWVLVSLKHAEPVIRSYRIEGELVTEEPVELVGEAVAPGGDAQRER
jgi:proteasome lid subunit RPN8/RPN11